MFLKTSQFSQDNIYFEEHLRMTAFETNKVIEFLKILYINVEGKSSEIKLTSVLNQRNTDLSKVKDIAVEKHSLHTSVKRIRQNFPLIPFHFNPFFFQKASNNIYLNL